jgi:UDP-N-acetylglucosamine acyltransferase
MFRPTVLVNPRSGGNVAQQAIHPTAVVSPRAILGQDVTIGPHAVIEEDVTLGGGCVIGPHAVIMRYATLGQACRVHAGAVIGDSPQDLAFGGGRSYVKIGDRCVIREKVTIHRGTQPESETRIGDDCFLMACCHVGHNVRLGNGVIVVNAVLLGGYVEVGDRAFLGGQCLVHQFTRIGKLAMLAGASGVQMDVPPFCMTRSMATNTVAKINLVGLRRAGFTTEECRELRRAFDVLYCSGLTVPSALAELERSFDSPHVRELCDFLRAAKRGICSLHRPGTRSLKVFDDPGASALREAA